MKREYNYYRIKMTYLSDIYEPPLQVSSNELVFATSYAEAETHALTIIHELGRDSCGKVDYRIYKTDFDDVLLNDDVECDIPAENYAMGYFPFRVYGSGLYVVTVHCDKTDDNLDKGIPAVIRICVPIEYNTDINPRVKNYMLSLGVEDFWISNVQIDKATTVCWPFDVYKVKKLVNEL